MKKFTKIIGVIICHMISFSSFAQQTVEVSISCSPTAHDARWHTFVTVPDAHFSLTTVGIEVKGEGVITKWNDFENGIIREGDYPRVIARCALSEKELEIYSRGFPTNQTLPTLICAKGESIAIKFMLPNDPNPKRYVYKAILTIDRDEDADSLSITPVSVEDGDQVSSANSSPESSLSGFDASDGMLGGTTTPSHGLLFP